MIRKWIRNHVFAKLGFLKTCFAKLALRQGLRMWIAENVLVVNFRLLEMCYAKFRLLKACVWELATRMTIALEAYPAFSNLLSR